MTNVVTEMSVGMGWLKRVAVLTLVLSGAGIVGDMANFAARIELNAPFAVDQIDAKLA